MQQTPVPIQSIYDSSFPVFTVNQSFVVQCSDDGVRAAVDVDVDKFFIFISIFASRYYYILYFYIISIAASSASISNFHYLLLLFTYVDDCIDLAQNAQEHSEQPACSWS